MAEITFTPSDGFTGSTARRGISMRATVRDDDGALLLPRWVELKGPAGVTITRDVSPGVWEVRGFGGPHQYRTVQINIPSGGGDIVDLIVEALALPAGTTVVSLASAVAAYFADNPVEVDNDTVAGFVGTGATKAALDAGYAPSVDDAPNAGLDYGFAVGYPEAVQLSDSALDAQYAKARAMGAKRIRIVISPADTGSGAYVWTRVDRQFTLAAKNGLTPHVLFEGPRNSGGDAFATPTTAVMTPLITAAVARYKDRCSVWEVLNEVNHITFWGDLPSPSGYKAILQAAYTAIHAAQPQATVVTAGLMQANDYTNSGAYPSLPDGRITVNPVTYLTELYAAGAQGYFDAVGNHPYTLETGIEPTAPVPSESSNAITRDKALYDLMVTNGDAGKKIWWTEVGYPIVTTTTALGYTISQSQAVTYYTTLLQLAAKRPWVGPVLAYSIQDLGADGTNPELVYGQYTNGGTAKSAVAWWQTVTKPASLGLVPSDGGDASTNTDTSVDGEVAVFSGTAGKTVKRATGSGIAKLTSGVLGTATAGTDYVADVAVTVHSATGKATPVDADEVGLVDSAASNGLKRLSWANLKAAVKTYLDGTGIAKLATARTMQTNLASTTSASFDGSANITPGVTGTLPVANGGTGGTTASAARTALAVVGTTSTPNQVYGTDNAGAQSTLAVSATADSWTLAYRDGSGRMNVNTPADPTHATPKAYVDGKVRTGVFQFEHAGALLTAGSALTYHVRRPLVIPHSVVGSGFRIHLRNRDHLNDANGGALTNVAIYIGEAAVDASGELTGNFAATPVQVQASTSVAANTELITGWVAPGTFQISPYKKYLVAYSLSVASGVKYAAGGGRFWYTTTASDVSVTSPAGITRVDNQGILDLYVEYKFADRDAPVMMVVSNSIAGGGNVGSAANRAELGAWPMLWALREKGVAASLAVGGAWCGHFTAVSAKWNAYSTLDEPLEVDAVMLFALTSSDVAAGTALSTVRASLAATIAKAKALWPTARIIVTTNSPRSDSSGTPETNRVSYNRELAVCPAGSHQSIEINAPFTDWASPQRLRAQFAGDPGTDEIHWSESAHATAASLIPVKYGAIVPHI